MQKDGRADAEARTGSNRGKEGDGRGCKGAAGCSSDVSDAPKIVRRRFCSVLANLCSYL